MTAAALPNAADLVIQLKKELGPYSLLVQDGGSSSSKTSPTIKVHEGLGSRLEELSVPELPPLLRPSLFSLPTSTKRKAQPSMAALASSRADSHHFGICGMPKLVVAVIASVGWMSASSGLILLNKDLLSHGFHYPMALSGLGMAFSSVASYVCCRVLGLVHTERTVSPRFYATKILPVGLCMALTLHFGNLAYLYLTVAFIQMLKDFTSVITMVSLFVAGLETPSRRLICSVCFTTIGTMLASAGELNLSVMGLVVMLLSLVFEAVRLVMTQLLLTKLRFHPIEGLMWLAPACTFWLTLGCMFMELRPMAEEGALQLVAAHPAKFMAAAAMGFMVNLLAYVVIQLASSLTLKVLGTVKNALLVCLGVLLLSEKVTTLQAVGYSISVAAFFWYQAIALQRMQRHAEVMAAGPRRGSNIGKDPDQLPRTHIHILCTSDSGVEDTAQREQPGKS